MEEGPRRVSNVKVQNASGEYEPLDPARTYTISGLTFLLKEHGDGYGSLMNIPIVDTGMVDVQLLEDYIKEDLGGVIPASYATPEGRITIRK